MNGMENKKILVIFGHPAFHKSRINKQMIHRAGLEGAVTVHDLYKSYPDFWIDVRKEQDLLLAHDTIVFQHPFYWYSVPALFKEWIDLVLEYGFAYGPGGDRLKGKNWCHAITTGGPAEAYRDGGYNRFTVMELLAPLRQTAHLCGMNFLDPFVVHGTHRLDPATEIPEVAKKYGNFLQQLALLSMASSKL